jgi:hypothetical protein
MFDMVLILGVTLHALLLISYFLIYSTPIFTSLKARFCFALIGPVMTEVMLQFCLYLSFRLFVSVLAIKKT